MVLSPLRTYSLSRKLERGLRSRTTALRAGARHQTRNETKRNTLLGGGSGFFEPLSIEFNSAESGEPSDPTKREENRHYYYEKKTGVRYDEPPTTASADPRHGVGRQQSGPQTGQDQVRRAVSVVIRCVVLYYIQQPL